jgi:hypothetical protein
MKSKASRPEKYCDACVFGYEVNCLVRCHHVMRILGIDPLALRSPQYGIMNNRVDMLCEKNPLIRRQISESNVLFPRSPVAFWKGDMERCPRKRHGSNLSIVRWRCHKRQI